MSESRTLFTRSFDSSGYDGDVFTGTIVGVSSGSEFTSLTPSELNAGAAHHDRILQQGTVPQQ